MKARPRSRIELKYDTTDRSGACSEWTNQDQDQRSIHRHRRGAQLWEAPRLHVHQSSILGQPPCCHHGVHLEASSDAITASLGILVAAAAVASPTASTAFTSRDAVARHPRRRALPPPVPPSPAWPPPQGLDHRRTCTISSLPPPPSLFLCDSHSC